MCASEAGFGRFECDSRSTAQEHNILDYYYIGGDLNLI